MQECSAPRNQLEFRLLTSLGSWCLGIEEGSDSSQDVSSRARENSSIESERWERYETRSCKHLEVAAGKGRTRGLSQGLASCVVAKTARECSDATGTLNTEQQRGGDGAGARSERRLTDRPSVRACEIRVSSFGFCASEPIGWTPAHPALEVRSLKNVA